MFSRRFQSRLFNHHSRESRSAAQALRNMLVHGTGVRYNEDPYSAGVRTSEQRECYRATLASTSNTSTNPTATNATSSWGDLAPAVVGACSRGRLQTTTQNTLAQWAGVRTSEQRVCYRATLASTSNTSTNPRATNATSSWGDSAPAVVGQCCHVRRARPDMQGSAHPPE